MPSELLFYFFKHKNLKVKLKFQFIFQCAPLLKGLKVSCGFQIDASMYGALAEILQGTGIIFRKLVEKDSKCMVLFYREKELWEYLNRVGIRSFLRDYGYEGMNLDQMLLRLAMRMEEAAGKQAGFPHEIGVFLGYPIEDVKGFIGNTGKKYLLSGYWKVYSDPVRAQIMFHQFDEAKNSAVNEFLSGMDIRQIAERI